jgi:hypothetical protein
VFTDNLDCVKTLFADFKLIATAEARPFLNEVLLKKISR